jgi:hypothetical protein
VKTKASTATFLVWPPVLRQIALEDWGRDWLVVGFNEAGEYKGTSIGKCLIRARWSGCPIGSEFATVFVLTDSRNAFGSRRAWRSSDFDFVSWAQVRTSEDAV